MTEETILSLAPEDGHSFYDYELADALGTAMDLAISEDDEAVHYVHLENGMMISGLRVEREVMSNGSKICTIYLKTV